MRGLKPAWIATLIVVCGLGASTASADLRPPELMPSPVLMSSNPPASLLAGSAVSRGGAEAIRVQIRASVVNERAADGRDAVRACIRQRSNCNGIAVIDSFYGRGIASTPKMVACGEKTQIAIRDCGP